MIGNLGKPPIKVMITPLYVGCGRRKYFAPGREFPTEQRMMSGKPNILAKKSSFLRFLPTVAAVLALTYSPQVSAARPTGDIPSLEEPRPSQPGNLVLRVQKALRVLHRRIPQKNRPPTAAGVAQYQLPLDRDRRLPAMGKELSSREGLNPSGIRSQTEFTGLRYLRLDKI